MQIGNVTINGKLALAPMAGVTDLAFRHICREHGAALTVTGDFCFNASPYTQEELAHKAHNYELRPCGDTVLCIDAAQSGVGSHSCGPELLPAYRLDASEFTFSGRLSLGE